jgi:hypothetical protein
MSKLQRKIRRERKMDAWLERRATRSKFARKQFEKENGRAPRPDALSEASKK